jgi:two-component system response regulator MprA
VSKRGAEEIVLVIEDDLDIRDAIQEILQDEGYSVFTADNGVVALDVLSRIPRPGLVLLDLMMPEMDGHQFLEVLRADPRFTSMPVVVVSAGITVVPSIAGYIRKPFDTEVLLKTVRRLYTSPDSSLSFGARGPTTAGSGTGP